MVQGAIVFPFTDGEKYIGGRNILVSMQIQTTWEISYHFLVFLHYLDECLCMCGMECKFYDSRDHYFVEVFETAKVNKLIGFIGKP